MAEREYRQAEQHQCGPNGYRAGREGNYLLARIRLSSQAFCCQQSGEGFICCCASPCASVRFLVLDKQLRISLLHKQLRETLIKLNPCHFERSKTASLRAFCEVEKPAVTLDQSFLRFLYFISKNCHSYVPSTARHGGTCFPSAKRRKLIHGKRLPMVRILPSS